MNQDHDDIAYLDTMNEVLGIVLLYVNKACDAQDDVMMGTYLKMSSRALRDALQIYRDHLAQNRAEMKQGEKTNDNDLPH